MSCPVAQAAAQEASQSLSLQRNASLHNVQRPAPAVQTREAETQQLEQLRVRELLYSIGCYGGHATPLSFFCIGALTLNLCTVLYCTRTCGEKSLFRDLCKLCMYEYNAYSTCTVKFILITR